MGIRKYIKYIIVFLCTLVFSYLSCSIRSNEVLSLRITNSFVSGIIPYKDFISPSSYLFYISLIPFSFNYLSLYFYSSLLVTLIVYVLDKTTTKGEYLFYAFLLVVARPNEVLLMILLMILIIRMELEMKKYYTYRYDFYIGLIAGLITMINPLIGLLTIISIFITKKNKVNRFIGLLLPILVLVLINTITLNLATYFTYSFKNIIDISIDAYFIFFVLILIGLVIEKIRMIKYKNNSLILNLILILNISLLYYKDISVLFSVFTLIILYIVLAYKKDEVNNIFNMVGILYLAFLFIVMVYSSLNNTIIMKEGILKNLLVNKDIVDNVKYFNNLDKEYYLIDGSTYLYSKDLRKEYYTRIDKDTYLDNCKDSYIYKNKYINYDLSEYEYLDSYKDFDIYLCK